MAGRCVSTQKKSAHSSKRLSFRTTSETVLASAGSIFALRPPPIIDTNHSPPAIEELLRLHCSLVESNESYKLEIARKRIRAVDFASTGIFVQILAEVVPMIFLLVRFNQKNSTVNFNLPNR
jgi:hypothetical protein